MRQYVFEIRNKESGAFRTNFAQVGENAVDAFENAVDSNTYNYTGESCCVTAINSDTGVKIKFDIGE